jgi:hypothetical protein
MCFAQDDLLKWGAALFLRFLGQSICEANMDARSLQGLIVFLVLMPVGEDIILPIVASYILGTRY